MLIYAVHITLLFSSPSAENLAVYADVTLNMVNQYCLRNDLAANTAKISQVTFVRWAEQTPIIPDVKLLNETPFLGTKLDSQFSWDAGFGFSVQKIKHQFSCNYTDKGN